MENHGGLSQSDIIALLMGVPAIIVAIIAYLVKPEAFKRWMSRWRKVLLSGIVSVTSWLCWRFGWLDWLGLKIHVTVWIAILYSCGLVGVCFGVLALAAYIADHRTPMPKLPMKYAQYGAIWQSVHGVFQRPPICETCLMDMLDKTSAGGTVESWICRQCGHVIYWETYRQGDLLEDVKAHYNAEVRRKIVQLTDPNIAVAKERATTGSTPAPLQPQAPSLLDPNCFELHGVRWYRPGVRFFEGPICPKCDVQMKPQRVEYPRVVQAWRCDQCGHLFQWSKYQHGDVFEDVEEKWEAAQRSKMRSV